MEKHCPAQDLINSNKDKLFPSTEQTTALFRTIADHLTSRTWWSFISKADKIKILGHYYSHMVEAFEDELSRRWTDFAKSEFGLTEDDLTDSVVEHLVEHFFSKSSEPTIDIADLLKDLQA